MNKNCIRVFCRVKPNYLDGSPSSVEYQINSNAVDEKESLTLYYKNSHDIINHKPESYTFQFSKVFDQNCSQEEIYDNVASPVIKSVLKGYNGTIFAYGQTNSGKTYTISGLFFDTSSTGIVHRSASEIFQRIEQRKKNYEVDISLMEIYNETGRDLLNEESEVKIVLQEDDDKGIQLRNLSMHKVTTYDEFMKLYRFGENNRSEGSTVMNEYSSRSHVILTIYLTIRVPNSNKYRKSKLHLIDLAGSERTPKTSNALTTEARHISLSLHYLEQVIVALGERNRSHIPYRNSLMTNILRDSLGGNCLTAMIATITTSHNNMEETLSTCRFSQRVALIKNDLKLNEIEEDSEVGLLKRHICSLKKQIPVLNAGFVISLPKCHNLGCDEYSECRKLVEHFLKNESASKHLLLVIKHPEKVLKMLDIFKFITMDLQDKRNKLELQAHSLFKKLLEARKENGILQKKVLQMTQLAKMQAKGENISSQPNSVFDATKASKSQHCQKTVKSMINENKNTDRSSMRPESSDYYKNFANKIDKLDYQLAGCKKMHRVEFDKLIRIEQKLEEMSTQKTKVNAGKMSNVKYSPISKEEKEKFSDEISESSYSSIEFSVNSSVEKPNNIDTKSDDIEAKQIPSSSNLIVNKISDDDTSIKFHYTRKESIASVSNSNNTSNEYGSCYDKPATENRETETCNNQQPSRYYKSIQSRPNSKSTVRKLARSSEPSIISNSDRPTTTTTNRRKIIDNKSSGIDTKPSNAKDSSSGNNKKLKSRVTHSSLTIKEARPDTPTPKSITPVKPKTYCHNDYSKFPVYTTSIDMPKYCEGATLNKSSLYARHQTLKLPPNVSDNSNVSSNRNDSYSVSNICNGQKKLYTESIAKKFEKPTSDNSMKTNSLASCESGYCQNLSKDLKLDIAINQSLCDYIVNSNRINIYNTKILDSALKTNDEIISIKSKTELSQTNKDDSMKMSANESNDSFESVINDFDDSDSLITSKTSLTEDVKSVAYDLPTNVSLKDRSVSDSKFDVTLLDKSSSSTRANSLENSNLIFVKAENLEIDNAICDSKNPESEEYSQLRNILDMEGAITGELEIDEEILKFYSLRNMSNQEHE